MEIHLYQHLITESFMLVLYVHCAKDACVEILLLLLFILYSIWVKERCLKFTRKKKLFYTQNLSNVSILK